MLLINNIVTIVNEKMSLFLHNKNIIIKCERKILKNMFIIGSIKK